MLGTNIVLLIISLLLVLGIIYVIIMLSNWKQIYVPENYYNKTNHITDRVIASLSTIPSRIDRLQKVLDNLEQQSLRPDIVYINLPYYSKRDKTVYTIPELSSSLKIKINRCKDYGPLTKLLPTVEEMKGKNDIIITIDDDKVYHKDFIQNLVHAITVFPDCAISFGGWNYQYVRIIGFPIELYAPPNSYVDIIQGFKGGAYRPRFFQQDFFQNTEKFPNCFTVDDVYISFHLRKHGTKIIKIKFDRNGTSPILEEIDAPNPVGTINLWKLMRIRCVRTMEEEYMRKE